MKKFLIIFSVLGILLLSGCTIKGKTTQTENNNLEKYFEDEVVSELSNNYVFKSTYYQYELAWYIDDELLEGNIFVYEYTEKNLYKVLKMTATKGSTVQSFTKEIMIVKSPFAFGKMYLTTTGNQEVTSKENYINGSVNMESTPPYALSNLSMRIRGRGNSSWDTYPKKSYRIKFTERQSLLGMKRAKDYVLLAEYSDKSLMRNYIAHKMSEYVGLEYTLETRYVEVYFNNDYRGLYLLTEQVEIDDNRLSVSDGGFLIELEDAGRLSGTLNVDYFQQNGRYYNLKFPDPDDYTKEELVPIINKIKSYLTTVENSLKNESSYDKYIDIDQLINYFIVYEFTKCVDVNFSSVFMYKDKDGAGLLKMGPVWDFDISMGNGDYFDSSPQNFWAARDTWGHPYLLTLLKHKSFKTRYYEKFKEFLNNGYEDLLVSMAEMFSDIDEYADKNFVKWDILGRYVWPNPSEMISITTHKGQYLYVVTFLNTRRTWLLNNLK